MDRCEEVKLGCFGEEGNDKAPHCFPEDKTSNLEFRFAELTSTSRKRAKVPG